MTDGEISLQRSITKLDRLSHLGVVRQALELFAERARNADQALAYARALRWVERRAQLIGDDEYEDFAQAMARVPR
jgi:hypothetical protein